MYIQQLAKLSGISTRTLRFYEEKQLLHPKKEENGYRIYSEQDIETLQQILIYKELDFSLERIQQLLRSPQQKKSLLRNQYEQIRQKRDRLTKILHLIEQMEEKVPMTNEMKFEAFKQNLIDEQEKQYGEEARSRHGENEVLAMYGQLKEMTEAQYEAVQQLEQQLFARLQEALQTEEKTNSDIAMEIAELHKRWLSFYWKKYTINAHVGLAQLYKMDARFTQYYDEHVQTGATAFLVEAIEAYARIK